MSIVYTDDKHYSDIADAIRSKGVSGTFKPDEMAQAVLNIPSGGITPTGTIDITENGTYDVTAFASALVNVSGGGSLPSVISKLDGGSFTPAADTGANTYPISHSLGVSPKGYVIWTTDVIAETANTKRYAQSMYCTVANLKSGANVYVATASTFIQNTNGGSAHLNADIKEAQVANYLNSVNIKYDNNAVFYKANCTYKWLAWA